MLSSDVSILCLPTRGDGTLLRQAVRPVAVVGGVGLSPSVIPVDITVQVSRTEISKF
jgi:hypothetical protein